MAVAKKKTPPKAQRKPKPEPTIDASRIIIRDRTLLAMMVDNQEQDKILRERQAALKEEWDEHQRRRDAEWDEHKKAIDERCSRAEEMAALALQTIASVHQDLRAITLEMRAANEEMREANRRAAARLTALEKAAE